MPKTELALIGSMTHSFATYDSGVKERYGGGVSYGGQTAVALEIPAIVITIGADDIEPGLDALKQRGLQTIRIRRSTSNNNSNDYRNGTRKIQARSVIDTPFLKSDFDKPIQSNAVLFFPGLHEVTPDTISAFDADIFFLDVGGLSRVVGEKNEEGLYPLNQGNWDTIDGFRNKIDILKISHEDLENIVFPANVVSEEEKTQSLADNGFPIVLLTRGERTTLLAQLNNPILEIPTHKVENGDTAGAGEVFSVAFMHEYILTKDPIKAAAFGNACASFKIAGEDYNYEKAKQRALELLKNI